NSHAAPGGSSPPPCWRGGGGGVGSPVMAFSARWGRLSRNSPHLSRRAATGVMRARLYQARPDILIILLLLAVPLLFFLPQTIGGSTMQPADNLYQWQPYNNLAGELGVGRPHNPLLSDLSLQNTPWK